eukprot:2310596-Ditylum_brightwellii.AAC.1
MVFILVLISDGKAQTEDWAIVKLAINHFVTKVNTIHDGHLGAFVIIMHHYVLLCDRFSGQWQSNSMPKTRVAALEAALTSLQAVNGGRKRTIEGSPEGWMLPCPFKSLNKIKAKKKTNEWIKEAYQKDSQLSIRGGQGLSRD